MAKTARDNGFDVSFITNGSRLDRERMAALAPSTSLLGLSIDSASPTTTRRSDGWTVADENSTSANLSTPWTKVGAGIPHWEVKANTVVNKVIQSDDLTGVIQLLRPEKWKVLRMLPVTDDRLAVSQQAFDDFVSRHAHLTAIRHVEHDGVLPEGRPVGTFFQNAAGASVSAYRYGQPILEIGESAAFAGIRFSTPMSFFRYMAPSDATE